MSELRKIKLKIDIDTMKSVANELGIEIREKACPRAYSLVNTQCDYVIGYKGREFGVLNNELMYDNMDSKAVAEFMEKYVERTLKNRGINYRRMETNREYVYLIS